jgi:hypothetical protein
MQKNRTRFFSHAAAGSNACGMKCTFLRVITMAENSQNNHSKI